MELQRKESKEFLNDLTTRDQRMMCATVTMAHMADSKEQLDADTETILSTARRHLCQLAVLKFQQTDGLNTVLPIGCKKIQATRTLTTESLVSYIGDMEYTLSAMLAEMQEMRKEVNMIHNSSIKAKCENLIHTADSKIRQGIETVSKAKNNLIASAENAVKVFKEKGKEAFKSAINAMKIPETLDKLGKVFHSFAVSMNESVQNVQNARMELGGAKKHLINAGRLFFGKGAKEQEIVKQDKGVLSRLQTIFAKMSNGFSAIENKSLNLADKLRYIRIKDSVKADLDFFNGKTTAKDAPTTVKDNVR